MGARASAALVDGRIGKVRVLQGGRRIIVAEKPADREDRLAMGESHGRICMSQIMKAGIPYASLGPYSRPECVESRL